MNIERSRDQSIFETNQTISCVVLHVVLHDIGKYDIINGKSVIGETDLITCCAKLSRLKLRLWILTYHLNEKNVLDIDKRFRLR